MIEIDLKPLASRILLAILLNPNTYLDAPISEQMSTVKCRTRTEFCKARIELRDAGFITLETASRGEIRMKLYTPDNVNGTSVLLINKYISLINSNTGIPTDEVIKPPLPVSHSVEVPLLPSPTIDVTGRTIRSEPYSQETAIEADDNYTGRTIRLEPYGQDIKVVPVRSELDEVLSECDEADDMDNSGDLQPRTPSQARRKRQVELIQRAYKLIIPTDPYDLTREFAVRYLDAKGNSAYTVVEGIKALVEKKPDLNVYRPNDSTYGPRSYIFRAFQGDKAKTADQGVPAKPIKPEEEFAAKPSKSEIKQPTIDDPYVQRLLARRAAAGLSTQIEIGGRV